MFRVNNCGCKNISNSPIEFEVSSNNDFNYSYINLKINLDNNEEIEELKSKIICEYLDIINKLECGVLPDLEFLLEEISLVEIKNAEPYRVLQ